MDADWKLEPGRGLGRLTFGLSPEEVAALAPIYGKPRPLRSHAYVAADLEKVLVASGAGATMSPQDLAEARKAAADLANFATQNLQGTPLVLLEYRDLKLTGVACEQRSGRAHFEGQDLSGLESRDVLALFERANGGPGRYRSTEAAFDGLAASLHAFSQSSKAGQMRYLDAGDEDFKERSVTLRREPYRPDGEMDQFFTRSVL